MAIDFVGNRLNELRNQQLEDAAAAAHERRMARRARFVESAPHAVSNFERAAVEGWRRDQGLTPREREMQANEMNMLKQRGENDFRAAQEKRFGMAEQGRDAARENRLSAESVARINAEASQANAEREWSAKERMFEKEQEAKRYGIDKELEGKKYVADASVDTIAEKGKADLEVERERGKSAVVVARENRAAAAAEAAAARRHQNDQATEKRIAEMVAVIEKAKGNENLTPAEKRAKALELLGLDEEGGGLRQFRK